MPVQQVDPEHALKQSAGYDASSLQGKSVVITGGASGIGEASLRAFAAAGAFVTFGDVAEDLSTALVNDLGSDKVAFVKCDTRVWSDQVNLFKTAIVHSPSHSVDIVLANAGISGLDNVFQDNADPTTGEPVEPDLKVLDINLTGMIYTAKLALHYFPRQKEADDRCLIFTSSLAGYADHPGAPQYSASKWGIRGVMRALRSTMPKIGARVNVIAPWYIATRIISSEAFDKLESRGVNFATVEDAASAVLHLASDQSLNGRGIAVVPRTMDPRGYADLNLDSYDGFLKDLLDVSAKASIRLDTN